MSILFPAITSHLHLILLSFYCRINVILGFYTIPFHFYFWKRRTCNLFVLIFSSSDEVEGNLWCTSTMLHMVNHCFQGVISRVIILLLKWWMRTIYFCGGNPTLITTIWSQRKLSESKCILVWFVYVYFFNIVDVLWHVGDSATTYFCTVICPSCVNRLTLSRQEKTFLCFIRRRKLIADTRLDWHQTSSPLIT